MHRGFITVSRKILSQTGMGKQYGLAFTCQNWKTYRVFLPDTTDGKKIKAWLSEGGEHMDKPTTTKYPIVFVHGFFIRDGRICMWGRVPEYLRQQGYEVYHGEQDANGSVADNAAVLKARILEIMEARNCEKVNLVVHSKGGLDSRYMITHLDMGDKVASLTTVATPHRGSKTMDFILRAPKFLLKAGSRGLDWVFRLAGDKRPKTYECLQSLSTRGAAEFNETTPDVPGVYYQSYTFCMKHWYSDLFMSLPYLVVYAFDGKSDGLVSPASAEWGNFRGVYSGNSRRGISHLDETDLRRFRLTRKQGAGISDITHFYGDLAKELAGMGF